MALQKTYYSEQFSFEFPDAYIKISSYRGNVETVQFVVEIFSSQAARLSNKQPVAYYEFEVPYNEGFTYSSIYTYMKTIAGFENAVDC